MVTFRVFALMRFFFHWFSAGIDCNIRLINDVGYHLLVVIFVLHIT